MFLLMLAAHQISLLPSTKPSRKFRKLAGMRCVFTSFRVGYWLLINAKLILRGHFRFRENWKEKMILLLFAQRLTRQHHSVSNSNLPVQLGQKLESGSWLRHRPSVRPWYRWRRTCRSSRWRRGCPTSCCRRPYLSTSTKWRKLASRQLVTRWAER